MVLPKTIVTSAYQLNFEEQRGGSPYKSFVLLTETLDALMVNNNFNFIVYTDKKTDELYNLQKKYDRPNVKLMFKELNSDTYVNVLNPIREEKFKGGEIYERIHAVKNYIEVIINKLELLLHHSRIIDAEKDEPILWLDAGLLGTSCSDGWRNHMKKLVYSDSTFLDKVFEKIEQHGFICLRGNGVPINYELKDKMVNFHGVTDPVTIAAGFFGGKKHIVQDIFKDYNSIFLNHVNTFQQLITEQEVLNIMIHNKDVKYYDFDDWGDLQRAILTIMDIYDAASYDKITCGEV